MEGPKKRWALSSNEGTQSRRAKGGSAPNEAESSGGQRVILSRKELAREFRREAYQRAKRARAADPRQQALKEKAKVRRRELYQQVKERQKARAAELEAEQRVTRASARAKARGEADAPRAARLTRRARVDDPPVSTESSSIPARARIHPTPVDDSRFDGSRFDDAHPDRAFREVAGADPPEALALDIQRALQNGEVRELMARLERESAALAAQHRSIHHEDDEPMP